MKTKYKTDQDLVEALKIGDDNALKYIYPKYYKPIEKWILQNSGSITDAKDIYQDAIMVFYKKGVSGELELNCKIGTYLFAISKNLWLKQLRKNKNTKELKKKYKPQSSENDEQNSKNEERIEGVLKEVEALGDPCKTLLQSYYFKKMDMASIAELLNYSNANRAKSQKYKCMQRLKKAVINRFDLNHLN